jgi:hypothetical protein
VNKYRNATLTLVDDGMLTWEQVARRCLDYMSEADVQDMLETEGFIEDDETTDEEN